MIILRYSRYKYIELTLDKTQDTLFECIIHACKSFRWSTSIEGQNSLLNSENEKHEEKIIEYLSYKLTYVFDISQTFGNPLPLEDKRLNSNNMIEFFEFLKSYSPYQINEENLCNVQGYWDTKSQQITLKKNLSIDDKISVLLHELTHALYDNFNYKEERYLSETFVESVAFIVADYFGLDTSMCSFNYITSWTKSDNKVILDLGDKIQKTANSFITSLKDNFINK